MRNRSIRIPLALAAAVALLVLGLAHLFTLRFESGDVYPPYSTLRSDPLGTKVFYSSLTPLRGLDVKRNIMPLSDLPENGTSTTLLFIGLDAHELDRIDQSSYSSIESWVLSGGRLVLTAHPVQDRPFMVQMDERKAKREKEEKEKKAKQKAEKEKKEGKQTAPAEAKDKKIAEKKIEKKDSDSTRSAEAKFDDDWTSLTRRIPSISLGKRWGFALEFTKPVEEKPWAVRGDATDAKDLPTTVSWHTVTHFKDLGSPWRTIYTCDGRPVIIQRPYGKGEVVLLSDSYLMSNEAMRAERHPEFLAWLVGHSKQIIFDESQHGVEAQNGLVIMARKYHLSGMLISLLIIAGLFIWKNSTSLVPPSDSDKAASSRSSATLGRESSEGLVNLLRRGIPEETILHTCFQEWRKSAQKMSRNAVSDDHIYRMENILNSESDEILAKSNLEKYTLMRKILAERNHPRPVRSEGDSRANPNASTNIATNQHEEEKNG